MLCKPHIYDAMFYQPNGENKSYLCDFTTLSLLSPLLLPLNPTFKALLEGGCCHSLLMQRNLTVLLVDCCKPINVFL